MAKRDFEKEIETTHKTVYVYTLNDHIYIEQGFTYDPTIISAHEADGLIAAIRGAAAHLNKHQPKSQ